MACLKSSQLPLMLVIILGWADDGEAKERSVATSRRACVVILPLGRGLFIWTSGEYVMLKSFRAENFRTLKDVSVGNLKGFNLVTGLNGSGKTSFLESLFLLLGANNATLVLALCNWRGESSFNPEVDYPFRGFFHNFDPKNVVELSGVGPSESGKRKLRKLQISPILRPSFETTSSAAQEIVSGLTLSYRSGRLKAGGSIEWKKTSAISEVENSQAVEKPPVQLVLSGDQSPDYIPGHFIAPRFHNPMQQVGEQLGRRVKQKKIDDILTLMKDIEPRVKDLVPLSERGRTIVYVDVGLPSLLPLTALGSGFLNYLRLGLDCLDEPGGILLIDEIEEGIHHTLMKPLLKFLLRRTKEGNVQIFASTHSDEIINALYDVAQEIETQDVCALRFQMVDQSVVAKSFSYKDLMLARQMRLEIRG